MKSEIIYKIDKLKECFIEENDDSSKDYQYDFTSNVKTMLLKEDVNFIYNRAKGGYNKIYYGAPGCGKSYLVQKQLKDNNVPSCNIVRTTFHQEYTNTDFVGQIIPIVSKEIDPNDFTKTIDKISYEFNPGPFVVALEKAMKSNDMIYLIIEEINRGNAASIFGDIFQLLDRVKDINSETYSESEYPITNVNVQKYLGLTKEDTIIIPSNLTIYATMNSSDQSVFTLDTAFKRRWSFEQISNDIEKDDEHEYKHWKIPGSGVTWEKFLTRINNEILKYKVSNSSSEDKRLGKYFVSKDCLTEKQKIILECESEASEFAYKVLEYIWDDVCKYGQNDWFDTNKYRTLEELINGFKREGLAIFPNIKFDE